jgi:hypothetical protein
MEEMRKIGDVRVSKQDNKSCSKSTSVTPSVLRVMAYGERLFSVV